METFERNSDAASEEAAHADQRDFVAGEEQQVQANTDAADVQPGNIGTDSKPLGVETSVAVPEGDADYTGADGILPSAEDRATPSPDQATANPAAEASNGNAPTLPKTVRGDEALHAKTGAGELIADDEQPAQDNTSAANSQLGPNYIDSRSELADSDITGAVAADNGNSQPDRTSLTPNTPSIDPATPIPAGVVAKEAKAEQSTESQLNAPHSQQSRALPAAKSLKNEQASASAKNALARKVKPAAPGLRQGAKPKATAATSQSKPFALGTAGGLLPGKVSSRRASASDYATKVRQAFGRPKPRPVGTSGSATVSFAIGASGAVRSARISRSSGKPPLDQAALAIVRKAAPFPRPTRGGQTAYTITINFR